MAKRTAPNFEFLINGIGLFAVENVVDANLVGPIVTVQDDVGVNAYPSARCVVIAHEDGSMEVYIPGSGHVADFSLPGDSLSVAPNALGVLLAHGNGWAFIGGALNFEATSNDGEFSVDGLDDSQADDGGDEGDDNSEEEADEPAPAPARGRGRPPKNAEPVEEPRRGRGRPPGSKNKVKDEPAPRGRPAPTRSGFRR